MMDQEEFFKKRMQELIEKYNNIVITKSASEEGLVERIPLLLLTGDGERLRHNERMKQFYKKPKAKAKRKIYMNGYQQKPEAKIGQREANKRYLANNPQALANTRQAIREYYNRVRRNMKDISLMPNVFPDDITVENHHLLNDFHSNNKYCWFIIPLPEVTHNYIAGGVKDKLHWKHNAKWIEIIFGINVKNYLQGIYFYFYL